jgi:hypothetical protein
MINDNYKIVGTVHCLEPQEPKKEGGMPWYKFNFRGVFPAKGGSETREIPLKAFGYSGKDIAHAGEGQPCELIIEIGSYNGYSTINVAKVKLSGTPVAPASDGLNFDKPLAEVAASSIENDDSFVF